MIVANACTHQVVTAGLDDRVVDVARLMRDHHVGDVVIVGAGVESTRPKGIVTDRDVVVGVIATAPERLQSLRVCDVLVGDLVTVQETDDLDTSLDIMRQHGVRRLPVVSPHGLLRGIVAFDDVIAIIAGKIAELVDVVVKEQNRERELRRGLPPSVHV